MEHNNNTNSIIYNRPLIYEGYFNDRDIISDEITLDIEQTTAQDNLSSEFILELSYSFNKTTVQCNPSMFQRIYLNLSRVLPDVSFINDFKIDTVISDKGTTDEHSQQLNDLVDFLLFVNELLKIYHTDYHMTLQIKFNVSGKVRFERFCKDLYNIWRCSHRCSITGMTVYNDSATVANIVKHFARVDNSSFMDLNSALEFYEFIIKGSSRPEKSRFYNDRNWRLNFAKHQKVPFFNHLLYMCNHPDNVSDKFSCNVYGYRKFRKNDLESGDSVKIYYIYVTLKAKKPMYDNTRDMFRFCKENFLECLKEGDSGQFMSGNGEDSYCVVCFRSDDMNTRQNVIPFYKSEHYFKHLQNIPLNCRIFYCHQDWQPYDPDNFEYVLSSEEVESAHKNLLFTIDKNKILKQ